MKRKVFALLTLLGAASAHVVPSTAASETPAAAQPIQGQVGDPLRTAVPMVYKRFGIPGARSSWDAQRSSKVVVQNTGEFATPATVCFYAAVPLGTSLDLQTWQKCYLLPAIQPGGSYGVDLDALPEIPGSFAGSALVYSPGVTRSAAIHLFADVDNFLPISAVSGIMPGGATERAYLPTVYADREGGAGTNAMSALFAQNLDTVNNRVTVQLFPVVFGTSGATATFDLAPGRSAVLNAPDLLSRFNGSAIVTARRLDGTLGRVGAHVFELAKGNDFNTVYNAAKAYVGFSQGSQSMRMATALCEYDPFGLKPLQSTAYAIQNVGSNTAQVQVKFVPGGATTRLTIAPGAKASLRTCAVVGSGFSGSAEIQSDGKIVAMGKAFFDGQAPGTGSLTAFEGIEQGVDQLSLPYVPWSSDLDYLFSNGPRTAIALQNTGNSTAMNVIARYFNNDGAYEDVPLGNVAPGGKVNTNPSKLQNSAILKAFERGLGSVQILGPSASELSALARVHRRRRNSPLSPSVSEDYMALAKKQVLWCTCETTVPAQAPVFLPYTRRRDGARVTGLCVDASAPALFGKPLRASVMVEDCKVCDDVCHSHLVRDYYTEVDTIPPLGTPPGANDPDYWDYVKQDFLEMEANDPCNMSADARFEYRQISCEAK